jgi:hypothetical protein
VGAFGPDQASDESIDLIPPGKTMPVQNLKISAMAVRGWTRSEQENAA